MNMHKRFIAEAKEKEPEVVIIGDSIIERLAQDDIWDKMFVPLHCLNFGIGGDQTQHVLWRLQNGELEDFAPKVIVVGVGTHNTGHSVEQVVGGILEIVKTCQGKQPQAQIIVVGLLPRGQYDNPLRVKNAAINREVMTRISTWPNVVFHDIEAQMFINPVDGAISHQDMFDYLHLTRLGYSKLCESLLEEIQTILKNFLSADTGSVGDVDN